MKKENEDERLSFDVLLKLAKGDFSVMDEVYDVYEKRFRKYAVNQGIEWKVNFNELKVDEAMAVAYCAWLSLKPPVEAG